VSKVEEFNQTLAIALQSTGYSIQPGSILEATVEPCGNWSSFNEREELWFQCYLVLKELPKNQYVKEGDRFWVESDKEGVIRRAEVRIDHHKSQDCTQRLYDVLMASDESVGRNEDRTIPPVSPPPPPRR